MLSDVERLHRSARASTRLGVGLMSGTSLDGLDIALCRFSGAGRDTEIVVERFVTYPFHDDYRRDIRSIFSRRDVDLQRVCLLNPYIAERHADLVLRALEEWGVPRGTVDFVASHGQTIYHAPRSLHGEHRFGNATLQIGDGDHLAVRTGIVTISDFRQKQIAAGGEGAPLAAYGDALLFSSSVEDRILLNIGGIANLTYLPRDGVPLSSDVGPGNTMMDAFIQSIDPNRRYDADGAMAADGKVHASLLSALLSDPFFSQGLPKTTGPELFNLDFLARARIASRTDGISDEDVMATLSEASATAMARAVDQVAGGRDVRIYGSGGGVHNKDLLARLARLLGRGTIETTSSIGIDPDAKEAVLFAVLANECLAGGHIEMAGEMPWVSMGKISLPS